MQESNAELQSAEVVFEGMEIVSCLPTPETVGTTVPVTVAVWPMLTLNVVAGEVTVKLENPDELVVIAAGLICIWRLALLVIVKVKVVVCPTVGFAGLREAGEAVIPLQENGSSTVIVGVDDGEYNGVKALFMVT